LSTSWIAPYWEGDTNLPLLRGNRDIINNFSGASVGIQPELSGQKGMDD
jgi:hypothetical protein